MTNFLKKYAIPLILLITLLGFGLRLYASETLLIDFDEPTYMKASLDYAAFMRSGDIDGLTSYIYNFEHPGFFKIVYGFAQLTNPEIDTFRERNFPILTPIEDAVAKAWGIIGRRVSVLFGTLTVLVLSLLNPLGGLLLAINTLSVKYTSQFYLEALPFFASLLSVYAYLHYFGLAKEKSAKTRNKLLWIGLSAIGLGITAASKYIYCIVGIAIVIHFVISLIQKKIPYKDLLVMLGWGLTAIAVFIVLNPYLWPDPPDRLMRTITFHQMYAQSEHVQSINYSVWQPILWLFHPFEFFNPSPVSAFIFRLDTVIFMLALYGMWRAWKTQPLFFIWFWVGLFFLLVWKTKWPQYTLIIMAPYCIIAAEGVKTIYYQVVKTKNLHFQS